MLTSAFDYQVFVSSAICVLAPLKPEVGIRKIVLRRIFLLHGSSVTSQKQLHLLCFKLRRGCIVSEGATKTTE